MVHRLYAASGLHYNDGPLPIRRPLPGRIRLADLTLVGRGIPRVFRLVMQGLSALMRLLPPTAAEVEPICRPAQRSSADAETDVPTQRRPRYRQVSQGMREGKGRTTADATSVGVGAKKVLHPSPGPSIADPKPNRQNKMQTQTPQPNNPTPTAIPALYTRHSRGVGNPSLRNNHSQTPQFSLAPSPLFPPSSSTELEAEVGAEAPTSASVLLSPSPLQALKERGIKGERVPLRGWGGHPPHAKSPEIPLGVVQSKQLRVQSMFNQRSIKTHNSLWHPRPLCAILRHGN